MSRAELKGKLKKLEQERDDFISFRSSLERKLKQKTITVYDAQFSLDSVLKGAYSNDYLKNLNQQVSSLRDQIQQQKEQSSLTPTITTSFVILCVFLLLSFFIQNPAFTGMFVFSSENQYAINLNETYSVGTHSYLLALNDATNLTSLKISGQFSGNFKVYLLHDYSDQETNLSLQDKTLVYDSSWHRLSDNSITGFDVLDVTQQSAEPQPAEQQPAGPEETQQPETSILESETPATEISIPQTPQTETPTEIVKQPEPSPEKIPISGEMPVNPISITPVEPELPEPSEPILPPVVVEDNETSNTSIIPEIISNETLIIENETVIIENETTITENETTAINESIITENESIISNETTVINETVLINETIPVQNETIINETIQLNITENLTQNLTENITLNITENITQNITENITLNITENLTQNITANITNITQQYFINFEDVCDETCMMNLESKGLSLLIEVNDNSTMMLTAIRYNQKKQNHAPIQTKNFADIYLNDKHSSVTLDLSEYFYDSDNDVLLFDTNSVSGLDIKINNELATYAIKNPEQKNYSAYIYATDSKEILLSNKFNVYVNFNETSINATLNNTLLNQTINGFNFSELPFYIDSKLINLWTDNPNATPRIIFKYKAQPAQQTGLENYLAGLKENVAKERLKKDYPTLTELNIDLQNTVQDRTIIQNENEKEKLTAKAEEIEQKIEKVNLDNQIAATSISIQQSSPSAGIEATSISLATLGILKDNTNIAGIYLDEPVSMLLSESSELIRIPEAINYASDDSLNKIGNITLDGSGIKICLIDTGVDSSVVRNFKYGFDFVNNDDAPADDNGHGTEVGYVLYNISPSSDLIVAKVLNAQGQGYESDVLAGMQYCIDQNASIISVSLGSGSYDGYCDNNLVAALANNASDSGIFIAAAVGNDGSTNIKAPSCGSKVFRVSASTKQDIVWSNSNMNLMIDALAPGLNINTKSISGADAVVSGTSIAVPFVTGTAGLLMQFNDSLKNNPALLSSLLKTTGKQIEYELTNEKYNFSRIDAYNAITGIITTNLTQFNTTNATDFINRDFELPLENGWSISGYENYSNYVRNSEWKTSGNYSFYAFNLTDVQDLVLSQELNLSLIQNFEFDTNLLNGYLEVYVDDILLRVFNESSLDNKINISYSGNHAVRFVFVSTSATPSDNYFYLDNIRSNIELTYIGLATGCIGSVYNFTCGQTINESCTLNGNLNSSTTCLTIGASNIIIEGAGYNITGTDAAASFAIYDDSYGNVTIKNFNIKDYDYGIVVSSYGKAILDNNTISSCGTNGIHISTNSNPINITNNRISFSGGNDIYVESTTNMLIANNILNFAATGLLLGSGCTNSIINNNTIYSCSDKGMDIEADYTNITNNNLSNNTNYDLYMYLSNYNNILNNIASTSSNGYRPVVSYGNLFLNNTALDCANGYFFYYSYDNIIKDSFVNGSTTNGIEIDRGASSNNVFQNVQISDSTGYDILIEGNDEAIANNTFLNVSYNNTKVNTINGGTAYFKWYLDVYVNNTGGSAVSGANVSAWDVNDALAFSALTNSSGYITRQNVTEYLQNSSGKYYYTNYTINAVNGTSSSEIKSFNLTSNTQINLTLLPSTECACGDISASCSLNSSLNVSGTCLNIISSNVEVDCAGFTLFNNASNSTTINITTGLSNITVKNCNIETDQWSKTANMYGIYSSSTTNLTVIGNTISNFTLPYYLAGVSGFLNFSSNKAYNGETGILLWGDNANSWVDVTNNTMIGQNWSSGVGPVSHSLTNSIRTTLNLHYENNFINESKETTRGLIEFYDTTNSLIRNSYHESIFINVNTHIRLGGNVTVDNCTFYMGTDGIAAQDLNNLWINNSFFYYNQHHGFITRESVGNMYNLYLTNNLVESPVINGFCTYPENGFGAGNLTIQNNSINNSDIGIFIGYDGGLTGPANNLIEGNTITNTRGSFGAITIWIAGVHNIKNNNISTSAYDGISFYRNPENSTIEGNNISFSGQSGIKFIVASTLVNFTNNRLENSTLRGIDFTGLSNCYFKNNQYVGNPIGMYVEGVYSSNDIFVNETFQDNDIGIYASGLANATFINTTFNGSVTADIYSISANTIDLFSSIIDTAKITVVAGIVYYKYYLNSTVKNITDSRIENATITAYDNTGYARFTGTTDANGESIMGVAYWGASAGSVVTYYSPYNINASHINYLPQVQEVNMTEDKIINFTLSYDDVFPIISFISPTPNNTDNITTNHFEIQTAVTESNLNYTEIYIYNSTGDLVSTTSGTYVNFAVHNGIYYFNATACDFNGQCNSTETRSVNVSINGCAGATTIFVCGDYVTESCSLNGNVNCSGTAFYITNASVTFNGAGYIIKGDNTGYGINVGSVDGATITNVTITDEYEANIGVFSTTNTIIDNVTMERCGTKCVYIEYADTATVKNSFLTNATESGIYMISYSSSGGSEFANNTISDCGYGFDGEGGYNYTFTNNTIIGGGTGLYSNADTVSTISNNTIRETTYAGINLQSSSSMILDNNKVHDNLLEGINITDAISNIITNNNASGNKYDWRFSGDVTQTTFDTTNTATGGKVIRYYYGESGTTPNLSNGAIAICVGCDGVTLDGLQSSNMSMAVYLEATTNSLITNINSTGDYYGIYTDGSSIGNTFNNLNITYSERGYESSVGLNFIYNSSFTDSTSGLYIPQLEYLENISVERNTHGIYIQGTRSTATGYNALKNIRFVDNTYGLTMNESTTYNIINDSSYSGNTEDIYMAGYKVKIGKFWYYYYPTLNYFYNTNLTGEILSSSESGANYLVNTTYSSINIGTSGSNIYKCWYVNIYVNDTSGNPIENAEVYIDDNVLTRWYDIFTNSTGNTERTIPCESYFDSSGETSLNNYTINVTNANYVYSDLTTNINDNSRYSFTLGDKNCRGANYTFTCGQTVNESCTLNSDLTSVGTCFTIGANNIIINGNGYNLTGDNSSGYGIYNNGYDNIIISNFTINSFYDGGIYLRNSDNSTVSDNVIHETYGSGGIILGTDNNVTIERNVVDNCPSGILENFLIYNSIIRDNNVSSSTTCFTINEAENNNRYWNNRAENCTNGFSTESYLPDNYSFINNSAYNCRYAGFLIFAENSRFIGNFVYNASIGIRLGTDAKNNTFENNILYMNNKSYIGLQGEGSGIYLNGATNNTFIGTNFSGNKFGIMFGNGAINNTVIDSLFLDSADYDVLSNHSTASNTVLNATYDKSKTQVDAGIVYFQWYVDTYVNDSSGPSENANVSIFDKDFNQFYNGLTISSGYIPRQNITEYYQNSTHFYYYTNYTFNATKTNYSYAEISLNITGYTLVNLSLVSIFPEQVVLAAPSNGNTTVHERNPLFIWNSPGGAPAARYELSIISNDCPNIYANITPPSTNYTPTTDLCTKTDNDNPNTYYNWTVTACNANGCGLSSAVWNFTIEPWVVITLTDDAVDFGSLDLGQSKNTTSLDPMPFVVVNDGNVIADLINVSSTEPLWTASGAGLNTEYFQMMAGISNESAAFNTSGSIMDWINVSSTNASMIKQLEYNDTKDSAYLHLKITVPGSEPPGVKQTSIYFIWAQTP